MKFPKNIITGFCLLGSALCASQLAAGSDSDDGYIYCMLTETSSVAVPKSPDRIYFSAVFPGDRFADYTSEFRDFVEDQYTPKLHWPVKCYFYKNQQATARSLESAMRTSKFAEGDDNVIVTNWGSDKVASIPLQDFNIKVSSSDPQVRVCVRDHECEDGDRIRVSVNHSQVFSGEIDNGWDCKDMRVTSGKNRVELYAINGTGNKGACSHADINTGEIRVEGKNSQVQSWRHQGGGGSRASIVVEVE